MNVDIGDPILSGKLCTALPMFVNQHLVINYLCGLINDQVSMNHLISVNSESFVIEISINWVIQFDFVRFSRDLFFFVRIII